MNIKEIQDAISKLSTEELSQFRMWFKEYTENFEKISLNDSEEFRTRLRKLRGSLKGTGILKALMEERRKESLL